MGNPDQPSSLEAVTAGTTAAILAHAIVYPLDIIKTKLQVQVKPLDDRTNTKTPADTIAPRPDDTIYTDVFDAVSQMIQEEGIKGLYRGIASTALNTTALNFAYFYWTTSVRTAHQALSRSYNLNASNALAKELLINALGGAMAQLFTNPIAVIATRQQTCRGDDKERSLLAIANDILHLDGWTGFWRGFKVNLILVANPMITYGFYQWLRGRLLRLRAGSITAIEIFLLGSLSKVLATLATHPLIVAKTMLQSKQSEPPDGQPFRGFIEVILYIIRHEGFWRLYKGLSPQIVKGFLVQGLMMIMKERAELVLMSLRKLCQARTRKL
ncbi:mitochondrial carrier domain-containing protein [Aspergillus pseudoustus]|uniref:Mitochondrial carrier domain-containing protein n=1 Tax=Aspergillus pseudoustus TaxID=1810923 RepID=A0ABR4K9Q2_9EURO